MGWTGASEWEDGRAQEVPCLDLWKKRTNSETSSAEGQGSCVLQGECGEHVGGALGSVGVSVGTEPCLSCLGSSGSSKKGSCHPGVVCPRLCVTRVVLLDSCQSEICEQNPGLILRSEGYETMQLPSGAQVCIVDTHSFIKPRASGRQFCIPGGKGRARRLGAEGCGWALHSV